MSRGAGQRTLVCELVSVGRGVGARPAFEAGRPTPVLRRSLGEAGVGDLALVALRGRAAQVRERIGPADDLGAALSALLVDERCDARFPEDVGVEVDAWSARCGNDDPSRHDLRAQPVVTIDPEGAKDHDDAIAVEREGDGHRLWVHIADVARLVPAGGPTDREAARRGTSVYVPGGVVPMLPERLSSDLCSLRADEDRNAVTAELVVDPDGAITSRRFYRSLIRSRRRLTYPEVDAALSTSSSDRPDLGPAAEAAERLRARRAARGALSVVSREPEFLLGDGAIIEARVASETPAHALVEECMVAANEAVAAFLVERRAPCPFRHHEDPSETAVRRLGDQLHELGVRVPALPDGGMGPTACREAAAALSDALRDHLVVRGGDGRGLWPLVLRSLKRAHYSPGDVTHSGLASPAYLHFTSPIRRYPDLLAHRALLDQLGVGPPGPGPSEVGEVAWHATEREREAGTVERRADAMCAAWFLGQTLRAGGEDTIFAGRVTGAIDAGLFLGFGDVFEGFLPARRLPDDHYRQHPLEIGVVGARTGRRILLGSELAVRVVRIDALRGRVELEPADAPGRPRRGRTGARRASARPGA